MKRVFNTVMIFLAAVICASCIGLNNAEPTVAPTPEVKSFVVDDNDCMVLEFTVTVGKASTCIAECGFYFGENRNMADAERIQCRLTGSVFSAEVAVKDYDTDYYVCYYLSNGVKEVCSDVKSISTGELGYYVEIDDPQIVEYDDDSALIALEYDAADGVDISEAGICYGTTQNLSVSGDHVLVHDGFAEIVDLKPGEEYFMLPYVKDREYVAYGDVTRLNIYAVPVVETFEAADVSASSAVVSGNVSDDCGKSVTERGFLWAEGVKEPVKGDNSIKVGSGAGEFSTVMSGLEPNRTYSVRAYAVNDEGMGYGQTVHFTTGVALAVLGQVQVTDVNSSSALLKGVCLHDGGEPFSECGFYYGASPSDLSKVACSDAQFMYRLTGLQRNTVYYVKPYSVNSVGTAEGEMVQFTTTADLPVVTTSVASSVAETAAVLGGSAADDGGADIVERGLIYGKDPELMSGTTLVRCGSGLGEYSATVNALEPNVTYYFKAYATNSAGTSYGLTLSFTTLKALPQPSYEMSINDITENSVKVSFEIASAGGCDVTGAGVYLVAEDLSESRIPGEVNGNVVVVTVDGLKPASKYVLHAYVVNEVGEVRSEQGHGFRTDSSGNSEGFGSNDYEW